MYDLSYESYTNDDALKLLEGNRLLDFEYELMNHEEKVITTLKQASCSLNFNSESEIMGTANMTFLEENIKYTYTDMRVRPWFKVMAPEGTWLRYPMGIYILTTPRRKDEGKSVYLDVDCYDKTIILREDKLTDRLYISAGSYYVNEIRKVLISAGINKSIIQSSLLKVSADLEYEIGTSKLDVINALLQAINYNPIHFDRMGNAVSSAYVEPDQRAAEYGYKTDNNSMIMQGSSQTNDYYNVPNIVVRYTDSPDLGILRAEYINNDENSPLCIQRRGRKIVDVESVDDIADQATLDAYTRRVAIEKSLINDDVTLLTGIMPHHEYRNCIFVRNDILGITSKYIEYAWSMKLDIGETMRHTLKKVLRL